MNAMRFLLALCLSMTIILSFQPIRTECQWYGPMYSINIQISPGLQGISDVSPFASWGRGPLPFSLFMPNAFSPFEYHSLPDTSEPQTIKFLGHVEGIVDDLLVTCHGEMIMNPNTINPTTIYILEIRDMTRIDAPDPIGELLFGSESIFHGPGKVQKLIIDGDLAYILINEPAGLYMIDLSNREAPELIHYEDLNFASATDMEIQKGWAFILFKDDESMISSWHISEPENIHFLDTITLEGWIRDIMIRQELILTIGDRASGLNVIDISDPREMELLDHIQISGDAVWMSGGGILTAGGENQISVLDYQGFVGPKQVDSINLLGRERRICSKDAVIYVLSTSSFRNLSQIFILNMDEETLQLTLLDAMKNEGICHDLKIYQDYLMAVQENYILLWDISSPEEPVALDISPVKKSGLIDPPATRVQEDAENPDLRENGFSTWPVFFSEPMTPFPGWSSPFAPFYPFGGRQNDASYPLWEFGSNISLLSGNTWLMNQGQSDPIQVWYDMPNIQIPPVTWETLSFSDIIKSLIDMAFYGLDWET